MADFIANKILIEAWRFNKRSSEKQFFEVHHKEGRSKFPVFTNAQKKKMLVVHTRDGVMSAHVGDWVIRGVEGDFYPLRHYIFKSTFAQV